MEMDIGNIIPGPGSYENDYTSIEKRLKTSQSAERVKKNRLKLNSSYSKSRNIQAKVILFI